MNKWSRINYLPNLPLYEGKERVTESKAHIELSKNAAKEGMVLLKNDNQVLPLAQGSKVALFGKGTFDFVKGGGGSGDVTVSFVHNIYDGFKALPEYVSVYEETASFYRENVEKQYKEGKVPGMLEEPKLPKDLLAKAAVEADVAVISISRFSGEGWDRKIAGTKAAKGRKEDWVNPLVEESEKLFERGDFYLTKAEEAMVKQVSKAFSKVVVVLNVGGVVDTKWFADEKKIQGVLLALQGGMEGGLAEAELLCGIGTPSGKLADTFAKDLTDYPSTEGFHESNDYVNYTDDIYVGYRYFETIPGAADKVVYPFGYGLSYTTFQVVDPTARVEDINKDDEGAEFTFTFEDDPDNVALKPSDVKKSYITATARVRNSGKFPGREVIQVYFCPPQGKLGKPSKVLAGYQKTRLLAPGESQLVKITFPVSQMASYDDEGKVAKSAYVLEEGEYGIFLGTSSINLICVSEVTLSKDTVVEQLTERLAPVSLPKRLLANGKYEKLKIGKARDINATKLPENPEKNMGFMPQVRHVDPIQMWAEKKEKHQLIEVAEGKITLDEFIAQFSDEELADLLGGQPNTGVANTFGFGNFPDYGVPNAMTADGPAGLRIQPEALVHTTAFPCSTLLACSWDPEIVYEVGKAAGEEVKENNLAVWLTPAINIHRSPLCGRNFEYYSEDPLLAGKQAAAMVRGVQSNRIGVSVKHFALNNKETNRNESDSRASERAIREIYLKPFEIVVKESDPWTVMSSYNAINGVRASESHELLTDILRDEWGFKGMVTTDWWGHGEHYKEVAAGNDIKMANGFPKRLLDAKKKKLLTREEMEICGKRILELILKLD